MDSHQKGSSSYFFLRMYAAVRGRERHVYAHVYAFWPYLEELSLLQPEVGSESFGVCPQLIGAMKTWLIHIQFSASAFLWGGLKLRRRLVAQALYCICIRLGIKCAAEFV